MMMMMMMMMIPRPEPDPPYGLPLSWPTAAWCPGSVATPAVTAPLTSWNPPPPRFAPDAPNICSSWDSPAATFGFDHAQYPPHQPTPPYQARTSAFVGSYKATAYHHHQTACNFVSNVYRYNTDDYLYGDTNLPLSEQPQLEFVAEVLVDETFASHDRDSMLATEKAGVNGATASVVADSLAHAEAVAESDSDDSDSEDSSSNYLLKPVVRSCVSSLKRSGDKEILQDSSSSKKKKAADGRRGNIAIGNNNALLKKEIPELNVENDGKDMCYPAFDHCIPLLYTHINIIGSVGYVFDPGGVVSSRFLQCFTSSRYEMFVVTWYPP